MLRKAKNKWIPMSTRNKFMNLKNINEYLEDCINERKNI